MSYNWYIQHIQQLMAMGVYNVPINVPTFTTLPHVLPIPNVPPPPVSWSGNTITIDSESDEDNGDSDENTLFCANLHKNVSEEVLYELFLQAGPIRNVHIPKDNDGKSRSYGFITYKYRSCPQYALRLFQGLALFGRKVDIKISRKCNINGRK